jgi:gamma-glutamyltranspeptidase
MSVVDKDGNAVALTQTNSSVWGSGGFIGGYFLYMMGGSGNVWVGVADPRHDGQPRGY